MYLGVHLGVKGVTAVAVNSNGRLTDARRIPRESEDPSWVYSESEFSAVLEQLKRSFAVRKHTLVLALPAASLYYRRVRLADSRLVGAEAIRYAAEPLVPVPIEKVNVAVAERQNGTAGIIAAPLDPWKRLLQMVDDAGWVCPRAVGDATALWQYVSRRADLTGDLELVCAPDPVEGAIVASANGRVVSVRPLCGSADAVEGPDSRWLEVELARTAWSCDSRATKVNVHLIALNDPVIHEMPPESGLSVQVHRIEELLRDAPFRTLGILYAYSAAAASVAKGARLENIRTGKLKSATIARRNRRAVLAHSVAAMCGMLIVAVGLWSHGRGCNAQAMVYRQACVDMWQSLFPGAAPPAEIELRLQSELAREQGLRRQSADVPTYFPVLDLLRDVIASLPPRVLVRIGKLQLAGDVSVISGQARTHGEVEKITKGLAKLKRLAVFPARSDRTAEGLVRFNLRLERKETKDAGQAVGAS